ncbi:unnamed protein product [Penicillium egyptiacum]|uniref:Uncharacterized protein n=1 Tax=Penicillium egyptiacum TaxID=1303716 RepID=A0A9W4K7B4_9EURO|nr:unnamed protein product [Penicillium egyptiacum]
MSCRRTNNINGPRSPRRDLNCLHQPSRPLHRPELLHRVQPATGRVAPTWNYTAVQVYGRVTIYNTKDEQTELFLRPQLGDIARLGEGGVMGFQDESGLGSGSDVKHRGVGRGIENGNGFPQDRSPDREMSQG